jgi:hypothetical protein
MRRIPLGGAETISASVTITPTQEGLTVTEVLSDKLDFWWAIRNESGILARQAGSLTLPQTLAELQQTAPITAPAQISWVELATPHFRLLAPPGSAAARDLEQLANVAEASFEQASRLITTTQPISIPVYLVPRVFWQGGLAYGDGGIAISYLDRNYTGVENWSYFVHEVTHALSADVLPESAEIGGLLGEGVAVYTTGGHYSLAPIDAWAAVLAASERYVPLCQLRYDFYAAQHEVAYQEGASFSGYLILSYGLDVFREIYAAQQAQRGDHQVDIATFCDEDNRRMVAPTSKTAGQLEQDWLAYLKTIRPSDEQRRAWELTVRFFDTMRRYQERFDPPARDLPPRPDTWDRATAAKFLNAATGRRAMLLESMLGAVQPAIRRGDPAQAEALLGAIEASIDAAGAANSPLSRDYDAIVGLLEAQARALRLGNAGALAPTLATPALAERLPFRSDELLHDLRFTMMQLDLGGDLAEGLVQVDGTSLDGRQIERGLYEARFTRMTNGWRLADWNAYTPTLSRPPRSDIPH